MRGGVGLLPTVSVPALKTDMEMTSATLPRVSVVGLGRLGAPLAAVLAPVDMGGVLQLAGIVLVGTAAGLFTAAVFAARRGAGRRIADEGDGDVWGTSS